MAVAAHSGRSAAGDPLPDPAGHGVHDRAQPEASARGGRAAIRHQAGEGSAHLVTELLAERPRIEAQQEAVQAWGSHHARRGRLPTGVSFAVRTMRDMRSISAVRTAAPRGDTR